MRTVRSSTNGANSSTRSGLSRFATGAGLNRGRPYAFSKMRLTRFIAQVPVAWHHSDVARQSEERR